MEDNDDFLEVYDEVDIASAIEYGFLQQSLKKVQDLNKPETHPDFDGKNCVDCDGEIPDVRLKMGKVRCVICQEILEKESKMYKKD